MEEAKAAPEESTPAPVLPSSEKEHAPIADPPPDSTSAAGPTPPWKEKAAVLLQQSSVKLRDAASRAGVVVSEAAEVASTRAKAGWAEASEVTSTRMKAGWESSREGWQTHVAPRVQATVQGARDNWQVNVHPRVEAAREGWQANVQPRVEAAARAAATAAAETGARFRKNFIDAKPSLSERVAEATRNSLERSRSFLVRMEILPPELNPRGVFGVSLERVVGYHQYPRPVPHIVTVCAEFIEKDGIVAEYLFDNDGNPAMITRLMKNFERDDLAPVPPGYDPRDVAQLLLAYFRCLPVPLLTYALYDDVVALGGSDPQRLREVLQTLPAPNLATLERVILLLTRVAAQVDLIKMDADALANEWAPVLLWRQGTAPSTASVAGNSPPPPTTAGMATVVEGEKAPEGEESKVEPTVTASQETPSASDAAVSLEQEEAAHKATKEAVKCMIESYTLVFEGIVQVEEEEEDTTPTTEAPAAAESKE
eukprot:TRINITY_DN391_c0_g1_i2.p1 TRINITY_DN391_c0_g1~~TRINITY_DN391_c0_g1_i2.p1  ORF type:complete len:483 (-),score=143.67 TRINITY_DN391_c0_g1_i2:1047-2495(-)